MKYRARDILAVTRASLQSGVALTQQLGVVAARPDGAVLLARVQDAVLAEQEGAPLSREIPSFAGGSARSVEATRARVDGQAA